VATKKEDKKKGADVVLVKNRRATFDYAVEESYEGGLVLVGSEVKSIRAGKVEMVDAFCAVEHGELYLKQLYVAPFVQASAFPHDPRRSRKVLLHKHEIQKLGSAVAREGYTLVPLRLYLLKGRVKVEIGLAKGKKMHDKRASIREKTEEREARAAASGRRNR